MKVINLFAGPGAGKSTTSAGIFHLLKIKDVKCELVVEYAKEVTYDKQYELLQRDQLYITAKQNRRLERLRDQVEWVVTDSPLLLGLMYRHEEYLPITFDKLVIDLFNTYDNINFFIDRTKKYQKYGRNQTEEEARQKDAEIKQLLYDNNLEFDIVQGNEHAPAYIINRLRSQGLLKS